MLNRWQVLGKSAAAKTAIAITLVLSLMAVPLPGAMGWAQGEAEASPPAQQPTPPGQLKRRGLAGSVTSVATSTVAVLDPLTGEQLLDPVTGEPISTDITILVVGDTQALITDDTVIFSPLNEELSVEDLEGRRLAILFAKGPANEDGTRTVLKIIVIPDKPGRTHSRGVIKAKSGGGDGGFEVEGDDGEIIELDDADEGDLEEGDEVILVTQTVPNFDGDDDSDGRGRPKRIARGLQKSSKIMERLERITDRLSLLGDSEKVEKLKARVEKLMAKQLQRFSDINTRFSDEGSQNRGRSNNQRGKGRPVDVGSADFGPSDDGDDDGKQNRGRSRNRGRSGDLSPQDFDDGDDDEDTEDGDEENRGRGKGKGRNPGERGPNN